MAVPYIRTLIPAQTNQLERAAAVSVPRPHDHHCGHIHRRRRGQPASRSPRPHPIPRISAFQYRSRPPKGRHFRRSIPRCAQSPREGRGLRGVGAQDFDRALPVSHERTGLAASPEDQRVVQAGGRQRVSQHPQLVLFAPKHKFQSDPGGRSQY